ncbi:MAG: DUF3089 domain-containing protein [Pseudomonadota bacterium]
MRLWLGAALVAVALYFGIKDWAYRSLAMRQSPDPAPAPDFTLEANWSVQPETQPPGGWERPWGLDVFLLPPPAGVSNSVGLTPIEDERVRASMDAAVAAFAEPAGSAGPVYAPYLRHPSAALPRDDAAELDDAARADAIAAFQHYLTRYNRERAIMLVVLPGAESAAEAVIEFINIDSRLTQRFAGVALAAVGERAPRLRADCSELFDNACTFIAAAAAAPRPLGWLSPNLPGRAAALRPADPAALAGEFADRSTSLSVWLDENAPKPAEPLEGFEVIDVAPIRRPGETD